MSINELNIKGEIIWSWLERIKKKFPTCQKFEIDLIDISESERMEVGDSYLRITRCLDRTIVYLAGSLIRGRQLGDDSFLYFRNWLIWCGLDVVETAIKNTDELYDRIVAGNFNIRNPYCENLTELGVWGARPRKLKNPLSLEDFLGENNEEVDEPLTAGFLQNKLPKLWGKLGENFEFPQNSELPEISEVYVNGLGLFRVGDRVFHKKGYGEGEILKILHDGGGVSIRFAHEEKTFWLNPEFFERLEE